MKKSSVYLLIAFLVSFGFSAIAQDDVYYDPSDDNQKYTTEEDGYEYVDAEDYVISDYDEYVGYEGSEEATDYENDYDFTYASRIRRFNRSYRGFGYFDPCYVDSYYYDNSYSPGTTIYVSSYSWRPQRINRWVYINDPFSNYYSPYYTYTYNTIPGYYNTPYSNYGYSYGNNNYSSGYGYGNSYSYSSGYGSSYDPCSPYGNSSNYGYSSGYLNAPIVNTTNTVRPNQGTNIPGNPTSNATKPSLGKNNTAPTATKPQKEIYSANGQTRPKSTYYSQPKSAPKYNKPVTTPGRSTYTKPKATPSKNYSKPSRSYSNPGKSYSRPSTTPKSTPSRSYSKPSSSSKSTFSAPSRSSSRSSGSSSGSSRPSLGKRGGK